MLRNLTPPSGWSFEPAQPVTKYYEAPRLDPPETNFNNYDYFYYCDIYGLSGLNASDVGALVKDPNEELSFLTQRNQFGFYMQPKNILGLDLKPGHLPKTNDLVMDVPEVFVVLLRWWLSGRGYWNKRVIPKWAMSILDQEVEIPATGNIYFMNFGVEYKVIMGRAVNGTIWVRFRSTH